MDMSGFQVWAREGIGAALSLQTNRVKGETMKTSRNLFFAVAALAFIGSSLGCYTLLKHPPIAVDDRVAAADADSAIRFGDDCSGCHSYGSLRAHHPAVPPPRHVVSPQWDYYYDNPWWNPYYSPMAPVYSPASPTAGEEQKKRPFDRRHQSSQDETAPASVTTPEPAPSSGVVAKPIDSGSSQPPSKPQPQADTNKRDEKRSSDSDSSSNRRTKKP